VAPPAAGSGGPVAVSEVQSWDDPQALLAAAAAEPAIAWRELALHWGLAIGEGEPCATAARGGLACFRSPAGGLAGLRQVQRPASLVLRSASGPVRFAVLVALDARQATLQAGASRFTLALPALLEIWRGEFNTFWRPPPGWRETAAGAGGAASPAWLDEQLARAGQPPGRPQAERVRAFQLAQGLPLDGLAGPLTLMQLGRFGGVDEPHLPLRP
jgi:general secretion pathway protein A